MKNRKIVHYSQIGDVVYHSSARGRNISIRINAEGNIRVSVPRGCSFTRAEKFLIEKRGWIQGKIDGIEKTRGEQFSWGPGDIIPLREGRIYIEQGEGKEFEINSVGRSHGVLLPEGFVVGLRDHADALRQHLASIGLKEAKTQLPGVLDALSVKFGLPYEKVSIRRMRTRWGSCSPKNNISLNSGLIFLPEELIEYVCLHELAHTMQKNHGKDFWGLMYRLMPEAKRYRKELHRRTIIA
jgi:predicted metal-dependent hydrolase